MAFLHRKRFQRKGKKSIPQNEKEKKKKTKNRKSQERNSKAIVGFLLL